MANTLIFSEKKKNPCLTQIYFFELAMFMCLFLIIILELFYFHIFQTFINNFKNTLNGYSEQITSVHVA